MSRAEALLEHLEELREAVRSAIEPLDDTQINTRPPGLTNTPGILLRHLAGSEREWIHRLVGGDAYERNREAEFDPDVPVSKETALAELDAVAQRSRAILRSLPDSAMDEVVSAKRGGRTVDVSKHSAILHIIAHYAYHHGQLRVQVNMLAKRIAGR